MPKTAKSTDRVSRRQVDKFEERRQELADAALQTLSELGYARTSLRDIAQNSEFSHGVLHYYFQDKYELITYCVRRYKAFCVLRYDGIVAMADSAEELVVQFADGLADTLLQDCRMHRLWYDLRAQSLFEESFRADVDDIDKSLERMIWRVVTRFSELAGTPVTCAPGMAYALFDGLFQQALIQHFAGSEDALPNLRSGAAHLLGTLVCTADLKSTAPQR